MTDPPQLVSMIPAKGWDAVFEDAPNSYRSRVEAWGLLNDGRVEALVFNGEGGLEIASDNEGFRRLTEGGLLGVRRRGDGPL